MSTSASLILASASPRRADLLASAGYAFVVRPAEVDETPRESEPPVAYVLRIARAKAAAALAAGVSPGDIVLAADTTVVIGDRLLGKPASRDEAMGMLRRLSGSVHDVHTAVVIRRGSVERSRVITTRVSFVEMSAAEIEWYVATGEPDGKAGAYAIQGRASRFVDRIEGSWSSVVGLPIATVRELLSGLTDGD